MHIATCVIKKKNPPSCDDENDKRNKTESLHIYYN